LASIRILNHLIIALSFPGFNQKTPKNTTEIWKDFPTAGLYSFFRFRAYLLFSENIIQFFYLWGVKGGSHDICDGNRTCFQYERSRFQRFFADKLTQTDLADAYAIAHNKLWWVENDEYDYEAGTPEHRAARAITDSWRILMDEYRNQIFEILMGEGIAIPATGQITVLAPFMARFGYIDGNGWWVKSNENKAE